MNVTRIAFAIALLTTGGAAAAQSATDAGCILVSNAFAQQAKDPQAQKLAEAAMYFYIGRIGDRETPAQLKALLDAQAKTITDANASTTMNACVKGFQAKMEMMQSIAGEAKSAAAPPKKP
jgi:hypothetical protein